MEQADGCTQQEQLPGQFAAADAGHHDVGDKNVDVFLEVLGDAEAALAIFSFEHLVTTRGQGYAHQFADGFLVFHQQDGFASAYFALLDFGGFQLFGGFFHARQINMESRARSGLAFGENVSIALLDDAVNGREAEAGAFSLFLGGKERFKDAGLSFLVHAVAGIGNRNYGIASGLDETVLAKVLAHGNVRTFHGELATFGHGVFGVDDQVHDDLLELAGVGAGVSGLSGEAGNQFDVFSDQGGEQALHVAHDGGGVAPL